MHIIHQNGLSLFSSRAANSLTDRDAHTCRFSLKWAKHQLALFQQIESCPVQIRKRMIEQRRDIGSVGDEIPFAFDQTTELGSEIRIHLGLRCGFGFCDLKCHHELTAKAPRTPTKAQNWSTPGSIRVHLNSTVVSWRPWRLGG